MALINDLTSHEAINGVRFGCSEAELLAELGVPDGQWQTPTGELEFHYQTTIFRCELGRFVECTFPDEGRTRINGVTVLDVFGLAG